MFVLSPFNSPPAHANKPKSSQSVNEQGKKGSKNPVTSTNSLQVLSLSNKNSAEAGASGSNSTMDAHYEANYKEKTLIEINRNRLNRKI